MRRKRSIAPAPSDGELEFDAWRRRWSERIARIAVDAPTGYAERILRTLAAARCARAPGSAFTAFALGSGFVSQDLVDEHAAGGRR